MGALQMSVFCPAHVWTRVLYGAGFVTYYGRFSAPDIFVEWKDTRSHHRSVPSERSTPEEFSAESLWGRGLTSASVHQWRSPSSGVLKARRSPRLSGERLRAQTAQWRGEATHVERTGGHSQPQRRGIGSIASDYRLTAGCCSPARAPSPDDSSGGVAGLLGWLSPQDDLDFRAWV
jgi:hypothetical protein